MISALLKYDDITIYPVNPAALAAYRKAFAHGGGKNDPGDALLLAQYLKHYIDQLRPLRQNQPLTRKLSAMAEDRRRLVDQRTAHCNELKAVLKSYFPEVLKLGAAKIYADFIIAFLLKYPSLELAQKAGANKLRKLFFGIGLKSKAQQRVELLIGATALSNDSVLLETCSMRSFSFGEPDSKLQSASPNLRKQNRRGRHRARGLCDLSITSRSIGFDAQSNDRCHGRRPHSVLFGRVVAVRIGYCAADDAKRKAAFRFESLGLHEVPQANIPRVRRTLDQTKQVGRGRIIKCKKIKARRLRWPSERWLTNGSGSSSAAGGIVFHTMKPNTSNGFKETGAPIYELIVN